MTHQPHLTILTFVGMTGSGKSTAVKYFTEQGFPKIYLGGFAYELMEQRGIQKGEAAEKDFRVAIRKELGDDVYARMAIDQVQHLVNAGQHNIIIDGIYSWSEFKALKHEFPGNMTTVAVVGARHLRYKRLEERADDRPQSESTSAERDYHEIESLNKGGPIAMADYYVLNDGSVEDLKNRLDEIAESVNFGQ